MRTVRMRTTAAGPEGAFAAGTVVTVSDELAAAFVAGGYAESADSAPATAEPPENAAQPKPKKRRAGRRG